jgi:hypothetical protein
VGALVACLVLWHFGMEGERVPILSAADLGFHELGHLVCYAIDTVLPWPEALTAAAGSFAQIAVPVGLAAYFWLRRRDTAGVSVCLAWAATSAADVARYIADAPFERLPLLGGKHDWATILGPEHLDRLGDAARYAASMDRLAYALFAVAIVVPAGSIFAALAGPRHTSATKIRPGGTGTIS